VNYRAFVFQLAAKMQTKRKNMDIKPFTGFSPEAIAFIAEWRMNNDRAWFQPKKEDYENLIKKPAIRFVNDLGSKLKLLSRDLEFDLGSNGSFLRIYRDVRFSQDKRPYNPNIRVVFWEGPRKKTENPGFYLKIDQNGVGIFSGIHMLQKEFLRAYRDAVVDPQLGAELTKAIDAVKKAGDYELGGAHYKRVPRGYDADHERAEYLKYNGLYAMKIGIPVNEVYSEELVDLCFQHCANMRPIQQWLVEAFAAKL
jgi:uncharacterized protein (TIGR02453 family)